MKEFMFATVLFLTFGSIFASDLGQQDTDCAQMVQTSRTGDDLIVDDSAKSASEVSTETTAQ